MSDQISRKPILSARAVQDLQKVKEQFADGVTGKVPERLVLAALDAAVRLARPEVLSERVHEFVRESLMALAQQKWKPDTALVLQKRARGGSHELSHQHDATHVVQAGKSGCVHGRTAVE
jgi:hypothetical protein